MAEMNKQMEAGNAQLAWHRTQEEYLARIDKLRLIDDDFYCTKSEDMYSKVLADEVKYLKETEGDSEDAVGIKQAVA